MPLLSVQENLYNGGYQVLTPVQMQVIPAVLNRRNILVSSPTGSGKSKSNIFIEPTLIIFTTALSFLLPLVQLMVSFPAIPSVLILAPTRELCMQIEDQAKQLMKGIFSVDPQFSKF